MKRKSPLKPTSINIKSKQDGEGSTTIHIQFKEAFTVTENNQKQHKKKKKQQKKKSRLTSYKKEEEEEDINELIKSPYLKKSKPTQLKARPRKTEEDMIKSANQKNIEGYVEGDTYYQRLLKFGLSREERSRKKREEHSEAKETHDKLELTNQARKMKRQVDVVDHLMHKQHEYDERRKQRAKERENKESYTFQPKINKKSRAMMNARRKSTYKRLYNNSVTKNEKIEKQRQQQQADEIAEVQQGPKINKHSKKLVKQLGRRTNATIVSSLKQWDERKQQKLNRLRAEQQRAKEEAYVGKPKINDVSKWLVNARQNRAAMRVEDRLLQYKEQKEHEHEAKRAMMDAKRIEQATPRFATNDALYERLYNTAAELTKKKKRQQASHDEHQQRDEQTGQKLFTPFINPRSAALIRNVPVEDILTERGMATKEKIEDAKAARNKQNASMTNQKYMGAVSELYMLMRDSKKQTQRKELQRNECTFTPKINAYSRELDAQHQQAMQTAVLHQSLEAIEAQFHDMLEEEEEERLIHQYTHEETIKHNNFVRTPPTQQVVTKKRKREDLLIERMHDYARNKRLLQQQLEAEKMSDCTFQPNSKSRHKSTMVYQSPYAQ